MQKTLYLEFWGLASSSILSMLILGALLLTLVLNFLYCKINIDKLVYNIWGNPMLYDCMKIADLTSAIARSMVKKLTLLVWNDSANCVIPSWNEIEMELRNHRDFPVSWWKSLLQSLVTSFHFRYKNFNENKPAQMKLYVTANTFFKVHDTLIPWPEVVLHTED